MIIKKPMTVSDSRRIVVREPGDIISFLYDFYKDLTDTENFSVVALDAAHSVISVRVVSTGTITRTLVHPREIFRNAIIDNSSAVVLVHNHPTGISLPSEADKEMTRRLKDASEIIGIRLLDHIILGEEYYSFLEHNEIVDAS